MAVEVTNEGKKNLYIASSILIVTAAMLSCIELTTTGRNDPQAQHVKQATRKVSSNLSKLGPIAELLC